MPPFFRQRKSENGKEQILGHRYRHRFRAEKVTGAMIKSAEEFGEEHGDLITRGIITGAAAAVGNRLIRSVRR